jgi:hypothetical protein
MSKNTIINIIYLVILAIGLIVLGVVGFYMNNVIGYIIYIIISISFGILVLIQKHRANTWWVWVLLWVSAGFAFPIAVLCLKYEDRG